MQWDTMEHILRVAREINVALIDITGGAPEMNPHFKAFVRAARSQGMPVQVRTNLTIMLEPGYRDMPAFFAEQQVKLVASLPCYLEENVDTQRGDGVYQGSIEVIKLLNAKGYGVDDRLPLDLVYNPVGPHLPPDQESLQEDYKRELSTRYGVSFSQLITITNMPIGRYLSQLKKEKKADSYRSLLRESFNGDTVAPLMCRHQIDVDWDGNIFDCDFNLALKLPVNHGRPQNIREFDATLHTRRVVTGNHCFGCTAGRGSSCGGALV